MRFHLLVTVGKYARTELSLAGRKRLQKLKIFLPQTVVLAIGLDSALLANQCSVRQSAGYFVTFTESIREAIVHFRDGDFDLVLLGPSIPADSRERLTFLIRLSDSRIPVVCITDFPGACDNFADATFRNEADDLQRGVGEVCSKQ
jgi:DNA-binding NtrC family response regulator